MTGIQIHAAPTAHGLRPAVRHPQSCIAPTLPAPSHAESSSLYQFHTSRRASPGIDRYSKQNGSIRPGGHLQSYIPRAISPHPNPGRRSAAAFHPSRTVCTPSTHHAEHRPELTDIQNRAAPSAPGGHLQSYILRAISPRPNPGRCNATAFHPPRTQSAALPYRPSSAQMRQSPPHTCRKRAMLTERQNCIALPTRKTKAASTRLLLRMNAAQQPNPRGGQPPRAYSLTLNTASSMLSPPLMPSASRFGRCASSGNITMKSPSRISTRAPSPSAKNSMSCSGS